jgi:hypothetical protein
LAIVALSIFKHVLIFSSLALLKNNEVEYQVKGYGGVKVDFLVNDMIVDTKYKPKYRNKANNEYKYQIEDIRKLSGYARDDK